MSFNRSNIKEPVTAEEENLIFISKEDVALFDKEFFEGRIIVIQSNEEAKKAIAYLSDFNIVGIDTESKPSFKKGKRNKICLKDFKTRPFGKAYGIILITNLSLMCSNNAITKTKRILSPF